MRRFGTQLGIGIGLTRYSSRAGGNGQFIPPAIKNSMVLWYDIKRQGATNESMAENPILKDLSGNGHDITCYNFAWSGMSGIGGYALDWLSSNWVRIQSRAEFTITHNKVHVTKVLNSSNFLETNGVKNLPSYKVKVTGLNNTERGKLDYSSKAPNTQIPHYIIEQDGTYELPANSVDRSVGFSFSGIPNNTEVDVTIELIPEYPNALVSDGVDDYAITIDNISLINFTLITSRVIRNKGGLIVAVRGENRISIIFEGTTKDFTSNTYSFGVGNNVTIAEDIRISIMTPDRYNNTSINKGDISANNKLSIFRINERDNRFSDAALYSLLLFDRTLTTAEIEWVKKNMIEGGTEI